MHIGATWRIQLNRPCAAAMRPYVKLLWPFVIASSLRPRWGCDVLRLTWFMSVCLSAPICQKPHVQTSRNFLHMWSFADDNRIRSVLPALWMMSLFSIMAYGVWRWQYLHERPAGACSHKFPTYLQGGATLFGFIVAYNGSVGIRITR